MNRSINLKMLALLISFMVVLAVCVTRNIPAIGQGNPTPTPTPSKSLSEQLGFSDPAIEELQRKGMRYVDEDVAFTAYNHIYRLISFDPIPVPTNDGMTLGYGTVLLFQLDNNKVKLIWHNDVGKQWAALKKSIWGPWPVPGDWQQNGITNFGVFYVQDSTCPSSRLYVYSLAPDGTVTSLFKNLIPAGHIVKLVEKSKDGSLLLTVDDQRGLDSEMSAFVCTGPRMRRYFEWKGTKLADISEQYADSYFETLGLNVYALTTWERARFDYMGQDSASVVYSARLMEILLIYEALHQRQVGFIFVQNLTSQALQTGKIKQNSYLDQVFLPTMTRLYQQNEPFIEPDYIGPDARRPIDYYQ